jgi:hypothetical protein
MKKMYLSGICFWLLTLGSAFAGNRADINKDHSVDAADIAILGNLLAGNLNVADYDLPHIVVVAKQGGDFWSLRLALTWVESQNPSATNRFLIYVAPGEYLINKYNRLSMPSFTTLRGASREQTFIVGDSSSGTSASPIMCHQNESTVIENLTIRNEYEPGQSTWASGLSIDECTDITIRNCQVEVVGKDNYTTGIFIEDAEVEIVGCEVFCEHGAPGNGKAISIYVGNSSHAVIRDTVVYTDQYLATADAACIAQYSAPSDDWVVKVYNCRLYPTSISGVAHYFYRNSQGEAYFYNTELSGTSSTSSDVWTVQCYTATATIP